ncbi:MAG: MobF family relaxase [Solirubrobacteraceae bacterium]
MLTIGRLSGPDSERYYLDKVATGREDYYSGRGEAPGRWAGSAVDLLMETDGEVSGEQFTALLAGKSPAGGEDLGPAPERTVHGFDLTFSAPKTVSLLYGVGDESVASATRGAHDAAVSEALGYLEREACWTRRGKGGRECVRGRGFLGAAFRHRTSRAGDPALHTHLVVANVTQRDDGRWSALDSRQLYRHAKTAGYLYQVALRAHMTQALGVDWELVRHGAADISGIPRRVVEHFSTRRAEVLELMAERGEHTARAAQIATLHTRQPKTDSQPFDRLRADWRARAAEHGFGPEELEGVLDRLERFPQDAIDLARMAADAPLPQLTAESSTFDRRDVVQAWAELHRGGAAVTKVEQAADTWLASPRAVALEDESKPHIPRRCSTPEMLQLETELIDQSRGRQRCGAGALQPEIVDAVLAERPELGDEQVAMVRALTTCGDGVQVVRAAAGTGKTYALDAAREAWQQGGLQVYGCALSARAAVELHDQTAIPTTTLARLQHDLRRGHELGPGSVLVVDEAGMAGTRAIAELAEHAAQVGAKLVLCGDDRQLPEIEAGGTLRGLAKRLGAIEMREVRRQRHEWDREALGALREGRIEQWADAYREHDRIVAGTDASSTRAQLVADWHAASVGHPDEDVVMLAHRRADVAELNQRARARLRAQGRLGDIEFETDGRAFAEGDRVVACRNDRRNGITNGHRGTITALDPERMALTVAFDNGRETTLPSGYAEEGNLDHAYAMTAHRAQGATVDRAFVLGSDDLYREWGYTALSRHREEARFYVNLGRDAQLTLPGLEMPLDRPEDPVTGPLRRQRAKQLAIDTLAPSGLQLQAPSPEAAMRAIVANADAHLGDGTDDVAPRPDIGRGMDMGM